MEYASLSRWILCCTRGQEDSPDIQLQRSSEPKRSMTGTTAFSSTSANSPCLPSFEAGTFSTPVSVETKQYASYPSSIDGTNTSRLMIDALRQSIYSSRIHSACGAEKWFIPQATLEVLMDPNSSMSLVLDELAWRPDNAKLRFLNDIMMGTSTRHEKDNRIYRKIFAVLLLMHKHESIKRFVDEKVDDSHLPFKRVETKSGDFTLAPCDNHDTKDESYLHVFDSWTKEEKNDFIRLQWEMIPVFFRKGGKGVPHFKLRTGDILPYVYSRSSQDVEGYDQKYLKGGFGHVSIYKLHSLQQDIDRYTVSWAFQPRILAIRILLTH